MWYNVENIDYTKISVDFLYKRAKLSFRKSHALIKFGETKSHVQNFTHYGEVVSCASPASD